MGKSKKLDAKLRPYYKGPKRKPTKVANVEEMKVIERALIDCLPERNTNSFRCNWMNQQMDLRMIVGLSAGLRHLKRGQTKALIFDDTAGCHTSGYLIDSANKLTIPVVQANNLILLAPKVGLKTLLVISLVEVNSKQDENLYKEGDPRPKPVESSIESDSFSELTTFLQGTIDSSDDKYKFKLPQTTQVGSTGKSRAKKMMRKGEKQSKRLQESKTKQSEEKARGAI